MCAFDLMLLASWIFKKNGLRALFRRHLLRDSRDGDAELRQRAVPFGEREALPERVQAAPRHVVVLFAMHLSRKERPFSFRCKEHISFENESFDSFLIISHKSYK